MKNILRQVVGFITQVIIYFYQLLAEFKHTLLVSVFGYSSYCKHQPSCSQYMLYQLKKDDTIRGLWRGMKRILTCW